VKYRYSSQILTNLELAPQIFEKYSNTKFEEKPAGGSRVVPWERTDRRDEESSRYLHFGERAEKAMLYVKMYNI
jgi:hypothetical protein